MIWLGASVEEWRPNRTVEESKLPDATSEETTSSAPFDDRFSHKLQLINASPSSLTSLEPKALKIIIIYLFLNVMIVLPI